MAYLKHLTNLSSKMCLTLDTRNCCVAPAPKIWRKYRALGAFTRVASIGLADLSLCFAANGFPPRTSTWKRHYCIWSTCLILLSKATMWSHISIHLPAQITTRRCIGSAMCTAFYHTSELQKNLYENDIIIYS